MCGSPLKLTKARRSSWGSWSWPVNVHMVAQPSSQAGRHLVSSEWRHGAVSPVGSAHGPRTRLRSPASCRAGPADRAIAQWLHMFCNTEAESGPLTPKMFGADLRSTDQKVGSSSLSGCASETPAMAGVSVTSRRCRCPVSGRCLRDTVTGFRPACGRRPLPAQGTTAPPARPLPPRCGTAKAPSGEGRTVSRAGRVDRRRRCCPW